MPDVAAFKGSILFKTNDPSVLLVGGQEKGRSEGIYQLEVQRDAQGHISGFSGAATLVADAPGNPAAPFDIYGLYSTMDYGPEGVLFYPTFDGAIGQIKAGSSKPSRFIVTSDLGIDGRAGGLVFVPAGFPGAGRLKLGGDRWLDTTVIADGSGTFDILKPARTIGVNYPSSMAYVFAGHSGF